MIRVTFAGDGRDHRRIVLDLLRASYNGIARASQARDEGSTPFARSKKLAAPPYRKPYRRRSSTIAPSSEPLRKPWQNCRTVEPSSRSFPSWRRGFDSLRPLQTSCASGVLAHRQDGLVAKCLEQGQLFTAEMQRRGRMAVGVDQSQRALAIDDGQKHHAARADGRPVPGRDVRAHLVRLQILDAQVRA